MEKTYPKSTCFKADESYGEFRMPRDGDVTAFKLVHDFGGVRCGPANLSGRTGTFRYLSIEKLVCVH